MSEVTAVPIRPLARGSILKLWVALVLLLAAAGGIAWLGTKSVQRVTTPTGLQYQVLKAGEGPKMTQNDVIVANYVGRANGAVFDASQSRGQPWVTTVNGIIPGMAEGLQQMQAGGRYRLWIPPNLGYGPRTPAGAPFGPHDTLVFDIEVLQIAPGVAQMYEMQQMQQRMQQMQGAEGAPGAAPGGEGAGAPPPAGRSGGR